MIDLVPEKKPLGFISVTRITETSLMHQCGRPVSGVVAQVKGLWRRKPTVCRTPDRNREGKKDVTSESSVGSVAATSGWLA
jgi:hypothetical protein